MVDMWVSFGCLLSILVSLSFSLTNVDDLVEYSKGNTFYCYFVNNELRQYADMSRLLFGICIRPHSDQSYGLRANMAYKCDVSVFTLCLILGVCKC